MGTIALRLLGGVVLVLIVLGFLYPSGGQFNVPLVVIGLIVTLVVIALIHRWWSDSN